LAGLERSLCVDRCHISILSDWW